jgi:hypothetical protein
MALQPTVALVFQIVESHKNEFSWFTSAQQAWNSAAQSLVQGDRDTILDYVKNSKNLNSAGDNLYTNATSIASYLIQQRLPVQNLDTVLPRVVQSRFPLISQKRLQDSDRKSEREVSDAEIATWRSRAEGAVVRSPQGHILQTKTAAVQAIVVKNANGEVDWRQT